MKRIFKRTNVCFSLLLIFFLTGCTHTIKREPVYIPTKCKIQQRAKPIPSKDSSISQDIEEILKYTELIESDLEFCRGQD